MGVGTFPPPLSPLVFAITAYIKSYGPCIVLPFLPWKLYFKFTFLPKLSFIIKFILKKYWLKESRWKITPFLSVDTFFIGLVYELWKLCSCITNLDSNLWVISFGTKFVKGCFVSILLRWKKFKIHKLFSVYNSSQFTGNRTLV